MNEGLIQRVMGRSNRNLLLISFAGVGLVVVLFCFNLRYFYNFAAGPFKADAAVIGVVASASEPQEYWITLSGNKLYDTGFQYVETSDSGSETVTTSYYALDLGSKLLLVKMPGEPAQDSLSPTVTGWLSEISTDESTQIIQDLETKAPSIKGAFLPFQLESGDFRNNGYFGIAIGLIILGLSLWGILVVIRRISDPSTHPVMKALARFGPLDYVVGRIEAEMSAPLARIGKLSLANNWMVYEDRANLMVARYEDVTWVYKHITTHRSYGIAVSKTYTAMVYDRFGAKLNLVAGRKEAAVNEMLAAISARVPWAIIGWNAELETAWNKDRAGFLAAVERNKAKA